MVRIAVVDDEIVMVNFIHNKISKILDEVREKYEIKDYTEGKQALEDALNSCFDIVFLDIDMPDVSGMEIAKKIRTQEENVVIVFITNKDELVYDAIKYAPFRFIRKSRFDSEINEALHKYLEKINNNKSVYMLSTSDGEKAVKLTKVRYVEVSSHKLYIHETDKTLVTGGNLKDIEEYFCKFGFIKTHQSYLVNYRYINLIKRNEIVLDNGSSLPLSRSKYESTKIEYMRLSREE